MLQSQKPSHPRVLRNRWNPRVVLKGKVTLSCSVTTLQTVLGLAAESHIMGQCWVQKLLLTPILLPEGFSSPSLSCASPASMGCTLTCRGACEFFKSHAQLRAESWPSPLLTFSSSLTINSKGTGYLLHRQYQVESMLCAALTPVSPCTLGISEAQQRACSCCELLICLTSWNIFLGEGGNFLSENALWFYILVIFKISLGYFFCPSFLISFLIRIILMLSSLIKYYLCIRYIKIVFRNDNFSKYCHWEVFFGWSRQIQCNFPCTKRCKNLGILSV